MATLYKLTTKDFKTRKGYPNECLWGEGVTHRGTGTGELCGPGFIHAYTHPLLAVLLSPIHAAIDDPVLWECEGEVAQSERGLKVGCVELTTIRQIPLPTLTPAQHIRFGLLCAKQVCVELGWELRKDLVDAYLAGSTASCSASTVFWGDYDYGAKEWCAFWAIRAIYAPSPDSVRYCAAFAAHWSQINGDDLINLAKEAVRPAPNTPAS